MVNLKYPFKIKLLNPRCDKVTAETASVKRTCDRSQLSVQGSWDLKSPLIDAVSERWFRCFAVDTYSHVLPQYAQHSAAE